MPNIHPFPQRTHVVCFDEPGDAPWLSETRLNTTREEAVAYLAGGQLRGSQFDKRSLQAVYALDLTPGRQRIEDVTAEVLRAVAAKCETDAVDLPACVSGAFEAYGVRAPISWSETDYREPYEDERQCYAIHGTNRWSA